ncbi:MAG: hypothetical protein DFNUSKGM_000939 [Candidatus Fervidibacter sacchari]
MWDVFENTCRDYFAAIRWEKLQRKSLQGAQGFLVETLMQEGRARWGTPSICSAYFTNSLKACSTLPKSLALRLMNLAANFLSR